MTLSPAERQNMTSQSQPVLPETGIGNAADTAKWQGNGRVLVCGGRDYWNVDVINETLDRLHAMKPVTMVIHGNAYGADRLGGIWAVRNKVQVVAVPAQWSKFGKRAGGLRNQAMLGHSPELVVAFPGGRGTADMVRRAEAAGVPVQRVTHPQSRTPTPSDGSQVEPSTAGYVPTNNSSGDA